MCEVSSQHLLAPSQAYRSLPMETNVLPMNSLTIGCNHDRNYIGGGAVWS